MGAPPLQQTVGGHTVQPEAEGNIDTTNRRSVAAGADDITQRGRVCCDRQGHRNALAIEWAQNFLAQILMPRVRPAAHAHRILAWCGGMVLIVLGIAYDVAQRGKRAQQAGAVRGRLLIVVGIKIRIRTRLRQLQRLPRRDARAVV